MPNKIIALYDFRSKQEYIYRTNQIKEITGASAIIADAYAAFRKVMMDNHLTFLPLYEGGGNFQVEFDNKETLLQANRLFSRWLLENTYSLNLLCGYVEKTENYQEDSKQLRKNIEKCKNSHPPTLPLALTPFTELDRKTSLPVVKKIRKHDELQSLSMESDLKLQKFTEMYRTNRIDKNSLVLDKLTDSSKEDSLLAIVYIDGNAMGKRLDQLVGSEISYTKGIEKLKSFSEMVNENFVAAPLATLLKENIPHRKVIGGGDEITIICNAHDALKVVKLYFQTLEKGTNTVDTVPNTSCAGIAIFHSHAPFSMVYEIAEECCESGKIRNRECNNANNFVDFHFCHSGIVGDLDQMRQQYGENTNRPYCVTANQQPESGCTLHMFQKFEQIAEEMKKIGRANVKALAESIAHSHGYFLLELSRIMSRYPQTVLKEEDKGYVMDVSLVYDLWFSKQTTEQGD